MNDSKFLQCFLLCSEESLNPLISGSNDEAENAARVLTSIPYVEFIQAIKILRMKMTLFQQKSRVSTPLVIVMYG